MLEVEGDACVTPVTSAAVMNRLKTSRKIDRLVGMKSVGAYEAKTSFARLLDEVAEGQELIITRHGRPVAVLKPYPEERPDLVGELRAFRKRHSIGSRGLTSREIEEFKIGGRR